MREYITILAGKIIGNSGQVHSFEPEKKNYKRLLENISLNNLNNVVPNKVAVYDKITTIKLNIFEERGWHSIGIPVFDGKKVKPIYQQKINTITVDGYCEAKGVNHINLLKIDVEGAEESVLKGSIKLLEKNQ